MCQRKCDSFDMFHTVSHEINNRVFVLVAALYNVRYIFRTYRPNKTNCMATETIHIKTICHSFIFPKKMKFMEFEIHVI